VVEQIVTPINALSTEAKTSEDEVDNEISKGNNLFYHPLSYVLFVLLYWMFFSPGFILFYDFDWWFWCPEFQLLLSLNVLNWNLMNILNFFEILKILKFYDFFYSYAMW
jgi:hypothetical protein